MRWVWSGMLMAVLASTAASFSFQNDAWIAPEDARAVKNPVAVSDEVLGRGAQLFKKNCLMCHGEKGKGDGPATTYIKPAPADITPVERQESWTDGEIFWKITTGKNPMPSYGKKLSEEERWMIVHFTRTLKGQ